MDSQSTSNGPKFALKSGFVSTVRQTKSCYFVTKVAADFHLPDGPFHRAKNDS